MMYYVWLVNGILFYHDIVWRCKCLVSDQLYSYSTWILYAQKKNHISNLKNSNHNQNIMFNLSHPSFLTEVSFIIEVFQLIQERIQ